MTNPFVIKAARLAANMATVYVATVILTAAVEGTHALARKGIRVYKARKAAKAASAETA